MKALLIVDIQNDFLPGGALAIPDGDRIIERINCLQDEFELIVATKDWHPKNHVSFASTHKKKVGASIVVKGMTQRLWPDHCIQDTFGADFHPALKSKKIAKVFYKGSDPEIDSYSAFFDNAHLKSTGLGEFLKEKGVTEIYIAGLATDYCVKYSALDALAQNFKVKVVLNACKGIDANPGDVEKAIAEMKAKGATTILLE